MCFSGRQRNRQAFHCRSGQRTPHMHRRSAAFAAFLRDAIEMRQKNPFIGQTWDHSSHYSLEKRRQRRCMRANICATPLQQKTLLRKIPIIGSSMNRRSSSVSVGARDSRLVMQYNRAQNRGRPFGGLGRPEVGYQQIRRTLTLFNQSSCAGLRPRCAAILGSRTPAPSVAWLEPG